MKNAIISEDSSGDFRLEYDNTVGKRHSMRLEALTYEQALLEARSFLGIDGQERDAAGDQWNVE